MPQNDRSAVFAHEGRLYSVRHHPAPGGVRALQSWRWGPHRRWRGYEETWADGAEECFWEELPDSVRREATLALEITWCVR